MEIKPMTDAEINELANLKGILDIIWLTKYNANKNILGIPKYIIEKLPKTYSSYKNFVYNFYKNMFGESNVKNYKEQISIKCGNAALYMLVYGSKYDNWWDCSNLKTLNENDKVLEQSKKAIKAMESGAFIIPHDIINLGFNYLTAIIEEDAKNNKIYIKPRSNDLVEYWKKMDNLWNKGDDKSKKYKSYKLADMITEYCKIRYVKFAGGIIKSKDVINVEDFNKVKEKLKNSGIERYQNLSDMDILFKLYDARICLFMLQMSMDGEKNYLTKMISDLGIFTEQRVVDGYYFLTGRKTYTDEATHTEKPVTFDYLIKHVDEYEHLDLQNRYSNNIGYMSSIFGDRVEIDEEARAFCSALDESFMPMFKRHQESLKAYIEESDKISALSKEK